MAFFNSYVSLPEGNGNVTDDDLFGWTSLYEKGIQHDLNTLFKLHNSWYCGHLELVSYNMIQHGYCM